MGARSSQTHARDEAGEECDRLAAIVTASHEAIISTDREGRVESWNRGAERVYGYTADEMVGEPFFKLVPTDRRAQAHAIIERVRKGEVVDDYETVRVRKDGSLVRILLTVFPLKTPGGRVHALASVSRDVTREREMEHALRRSNEALRHFANIVAHDLRAPLRQIDAYASFLERDHAHALDADARELVSGVQDGVERMRALMDAVLRLSSVERHGQELRPVDAGEECRAALHMLSEEVQEADARVVVEDLPVVRADPAQLRQLFQNLVQNAVKYRADEPPRIRVSAVRNGDDWVFSIADNGRGLRRENRERVFRFFERGVPSTDVTSGMGIGLAIAQRIVQRHGGRIWAEPREGGGTVFRFTMPAGPEGQPPRP